MTKFDANDYYTTQRISYPNRILNSFSKYLTNVATGTYVLLSSPIAAAKEFMIKQETSFDTKGYFEALNIFVNSKRDDGLLGSLNSLFRDLNGNPQEYEKPESWKQQHNELFGDEDE